MNAPERPKTASSLRNKQIDMIEFINFVIDDLQTISDRLYLLENNMGTRGRHPYPRALSSVKHREAIKLAREFAN